MKLSKQVLLFIQHKTKRILFISKQYITVYYIYLYVLTELCTLYLHKYKASKIKTDVLLFSL